LTSKQLKITNKIQSDERKKRSLWKFISWILKMLTPFRVAIGIFCFKISLLIVYSMLITNIDRLFNSECGYKCGYLLEKSPSFFNPLDWTLKMLSNHHENFYSVQLFLDTTFFAIILLYTFICILYGIVKIGINFFSFEIFRIRRRDTMPQALSIVSILMILMMFAFSMQLMSIAPMYVTFGDQKHQIIDTETVDKNYEACTLKQSTMNHEFTN